MDLSLIFNRLLDQDLEKKELCSFFKIFIRVSTSHKSTGEGGQVVII